MNGEQEVDVMESIEDSSPDAIRREINRRLATRNSYLQQFQRIAILVDRRPPIASAAPPGTPRGKSANIPMTPTTPRKTPRTARGEESSWFGDPIVSAKDKNMVCMPVPNARKVTEECSQVEMIRNGTNGVFDEVVLPLLMTSNENLVLFAYGPTGTGKTTSMFYPWTIVEKRGAVTPKLDGVEDGLLVRLAQFLFEPRNGVASVSMSIRQVSFRKPRGDDLLAPVRVFSDQDVREKTMRALENRDVLATNANAYSSRSHLLVSFAVSYHDSTNIRNITLIDLAGSENVLQTSAVPATKDSNASRDSDIWQSGVWINKSLAGLKTLLSKTFSERGDTGVDVSDWNFILASFLDSNPKDRYRMTANTRVLAFLFANVYSSDSISSIRAFNFEVKQRILSSQEQSELQQLTRDVLVLEKQLRTSVETLNKEKAVSQSDPCADIRMRLMRKEIEYGNLERELEQWKMLNNGGSSGSVSKDIETRVFQVLDQLLSQYKTLERQVLDHFEADHETLKQLGLRKS